MFRKCLSTQSMQCSKDTSFILLDLQYSIYQCLIVVISKSVKKSTRHIGLSSKLNKALQCSLQAKAGYGSNPN